MALKNGSKDIQIHFLSSDFMPSLVLLWKTLCEGYTDWIWSWEDRPNVCDDAWTLLHDVTFLMSPFKNEIIRTIISQAIWHPFIWIKRSKDFDINRSSFFHKQDVGTSVPAETTKGPSSPLNLQKCQSILGHWLSILWFISCFFWPGKCTEGSWSCMKNIITGGCVSDIYPRVKGGPAANT